MSMQTQAQAQATRPLWTVLLRLALFGVAFFVAYRLAMSFSGEAAAPFWFPDAVLLCALLLNPPRTWWLFLLAPLPIRLLVSGSAGIPAWFLLATFVIDSVKCLLAATLLRRFLRNPARFDTSRDFGIFVSFAVLLVPMLAALAGAAVRQRLGYEFWSSWQEWFLGNSLASLLLTPAILYWVFRPRAEDRRFTARHTAEALLLAAGLTTIAWLAFSGRLQYPYDYLALLYAPVPFLIWAAIRFGLRGASGGLCLMAFLAIEAAARGRGPFFGQPPGQTVISIQLFLLVIGAPVLFVAVLVRERRQVEGRLGESVSRYREVVESQTDLICRYTPDTTLTFVNEAYCRYFGRSREELLGRRFLELLPENAREAAERHVVSLLENPIVVPDEHAVLRPDGSIGWQQWVDHAIRGRDGRVLEFQAIGRDITDRKRAEEANRKLAHVGRMALLGELTAGIAHEINQPLGAILSNAEAAEMMLESGDGDLQELRAILADIRREDLRASEVIRHVRALVGQRAMVFSALDLQEIAAGVLRLAGADVRRRGITVETRFEGPLPTVRGDRVWLEQLLLNLLLNAMDAIGDSPAGRRRIALSAGPFGPEAVQFSVTDTGHGLAADLLPRLFHSFVTTRENGMGLGLSISRSIVEAHGGTIRAENNPDGGAIFRFTLPASQIVSRSLGDPA